MAELEKLLCTDSRVEAVKKINAIIEKGGGGTGLQMFDTILKDHVLTYEESKGLALQGTYVYKEAIAGSRYGYADFYNKVIEEYNEATETETVNSVNVKVHSNGHKFYDISQKDQVDEIFTSTGMAWMYGIDQENERVFLPRDTEKIHGKLLDSGVNGTEWYRVYSDGFCQQGGLSPAIGVGGTVTVTLLKKFANSDYTLLCSWVSGGNASVDDNPIPNSKTTTGFKIYATVHGANDGYKLQAHWQASGYVNLGNSVEVEKHTYICVGNSEVTSSITEVVEVTTTENDTTPLFTGMYFDFTPNNVAWLKAGQQANSGGVYTTAYNELVNELASPKYGLKVVNEVDMIAGIDYSEYWKVNQIDMTFITPTAISNKALSGAVVGNGMTMGLTNGSTNYGLVANNQTNNPYSIVATSKYGTSVGDTTTPSGYSSTYSTLGITTDASKSGIIAEQSTAQLYFKVANAVQNLELLDAGEVLEALADKIGRQDCKAYIVETYQNGISWYRVYSDGWCEQGGMVSNATRCYFLKPYNNYDYELHLQVVGSGNYASTVLDTSSDGTSFLAGNNLGWGMHWRACGYIS